ncbi:MAG: hypothetical protein ACI90V_001862 [Bacillariaceae sp.]|jgi:hypothetical protein
MIRLLRLNLTSHGCINTTKNIADVRNLKSSNDDVLKSTQDEIICALAKTLHTMLIKQIQDLINKNRTDEQLIIYNSYQVFLSDC